MLAGEYSVLHGGHALAATLSCGMTITVDWHPHAAEWEIHSNLWPEPKFVVDDHSPQLDMLCRAVQYAAKRTGMHGGTIRVKSDLDLSAGVGSSSALRLGICGAFLSLKNDPQKTNTGTLPIEAIQAAWTLQSEGQGTASGYDIVTQYAGGLVEFSFEHSDHRWRPSWFRHDLNGLEDVVHVFVGGHGAPTTKTINSTSSWLEFGNRFDRLMEISETLVDAFNFTIKWPTVDSVKKLASACGAVRTLFTGNPNFPNQVKEKLATIPGLDQTWSWKTTGAGGEDAILLIGTRHTARAAMLALLEIGWHPIDYPFAAGAARITGAPREILDNPESKQASSTPRPSSGGANK